MAICAPSVGLSLPAACLRAGVPWSKQSLLPSVPATVLPAALGITGSSELCREGSIPDLLLCCALELAGAGGALSIAGQRAMGP